MLNYIDTKLNVVTMYRLTLYCLLGLLVYACVLGYAGLIPYPPFALVFSTVYIGFFCWITNLIFARVFKVPANVESLYITALILVFIITPIRSFTDVAFYILAAWAPALAMASKYIVAIKKKHVFNPAAIAVLLTALFLGQSASWWIGTTWMVPSVLLGGFLIVRKTIRADLVLSFLGVSIVTLVLSHDLGITSTVITIEKFLFTSAAFFFACIMLTEPLTTPPTKLLRIVYGTLVGFLIVPTMHIGSLYTTPELALVIGNMFAYLVSPKEKLVLKLLEKKEIGANTFDLIFSPDQQFSFRPGQYMEWTLPNNHADNRGNRRYFTIASSPTEATVRIGIKSYENMSTFKKSLLLLKQGNTIVASQRAGEFVLPADPNRKLVFIAGGIGVTPFRSMLKYLLDKKEKRDIVLFYSNRVVADIVYRDIFDVARDVLDIRTVYTLTDTASASPQWSGEKGYVDADMIRRHVLDLNERYFFVSGSHAGVSAFEKMLSDMGIKKNHIKTDFFPGFV